ncbi:hypothetical protein RND81_12G104200 [Saponaria officinalis]|uniref:Uncharacterized protein n=1 Tax=Saponaria officinalis TaxID=3572 RepID=A0AAW1H8Y5_SAPOF
MACLTIEHGLNISLPCSFTPLWLFRSISSYKSVIKIQILITIVGIHIPSGRSNNSNHQILERSHNPSDSIILYAASTIAVAKSNAMSDQQRNCTYCTIINGVEPSRAIVSAGTHKGRKTIHKKKIVLMGDMA